MALARLLYGGGAAELNKAARLGDRLASADCQQTPLVYQRQSLVSTGLCWIGGGTRASGDVGELSAKINRRVQCPGA